MSCGCKERNQKDTANSHLNLLAKELDAQMSPTEGCLYCAEKHLATASCLAREIGYEPVNRGYIIGEIVAACWHLNGTKIERAIKLANDLRDFRHKIQSRTADTECQNFSTYLGEIDAIIKEELKKEAAAS